MDKTIRTKVWLGDILTTRLTNLMHKNSNVIIYFMDTIVKVHSLELWGVVMCVLCFYVQEPVQSDKLLFTEI